MYSPSEELFKFENVLSSCWWWSLPKKLVLGYGIWLLLLSNTELHFLPWSGFISASWTNCFYTMSPTGPWYCEGIIVSLVCLSLSIIKKTDHIRHMLMAYRCGEIHTLYLIEMSNYQFLVVAVLSNWEKNSNLYNYVLLCRLKECDQKWSFCFTIYTHVGIIIQTSI